MNRPSDSVSLAGPTRTDKGVTPPRPQRGASANSATASELYDYFARVRQTPIREDTPSSTFLLPTGETVIIDAEFAGILARVRWVVKRRLDQPDLVYAQWSYRLGGRGSKRKTIPLHRLVSGALPGEIVDHRNGDTLDNRRWNLRLTNHRGNATNRRASPGEYKGVSWNRRACKWEAAIGAGELKACGRRRRVYLGVFWTEEEAAQAYNDAAVVAFGEFAQLNVVGRPGETTCPIRSVSD